MEGRLLADGADSLSQASEDQTAGNFNDAKGRAKADRIVEVDIDTVRQDLADYSTSMASRSDNVTNVPEYDGSKPSSALDARAQPRLYRDSKTGELAINSFDTISFTAGSSSCRQIGESIIRDAKAPPDALKVLAESRLISVLRICAVNGSVILNCRNGTATISPRKIRPDDGCARQDAG